MNDFDFSGKKILITGGTRGIGAAIVKQFHLSGADIILTGTTSKGLEESQIRNEKEGLYGIHYRQADFTDKLSLDSFLSYVESITDLDILINNAGINRNNLITDIVRSDYDRILQVNLVAPSLICQSACRVLKNRKYGRIVNIASIWGSISKAGRSVYAETKAGLQGFTRTIAVDMAPYGVLINSLSPGFTRTELTEAMLTVEEIEELAAQVPLKRIAEPYEMAKVALFLSSDLNTYITGQNIIVDGGFTIV